MLFYILYKLINITIAFCINTSNIVLHLIIFDVILLKSKFYTHSIIFLSSHLGYLWKEIKKNNNYTMDTMRGE